jgi:hypothetical protein
MAVSWQNRGIHEEIYMMGVAENFARRGKSK